MHTESGLPFSGAVPLSRHTSMKGAESAEKKAPSQLLRMIVLLVHAVDGYTDHELAHALSIPLASVCARRAQLREAELIYAQGTRPGPTGEPNAVWRWRR